MFLKSLELQGFKSFPDKTVLNFNKGITAVVGPNGSGKSNISDAIRWVLGEQSSKNLRGSKMEDVIFSGTAARKAQGFAQVKLVLDNTDRQLDFDNDEVEVTRRYYRSGESEYILNGATVRLKDINELFMDTGLGRDGYSLISQGKIETLVSAKSEDRRDIFEEAAGISKYRYRRRDAQRKLSQAQENMVRLLDIFSELEGRVEPLRVQSEKAQKFLTYSSRKKDLEIGLWLDTISRSNEKLREQEKKISLAQSQYDECEKILKDIEEKNREIFEDTAKQNVVIEHIRGNISEYEEDAVRCEGQVEVLNQTISHNDDTISRIREEAGRADENAQIIDEQIAEKNSLIKSLEQRIEQYREKLRLVSVDMQNLMNEDSESGERISQVSGQIARLGISLNELRIEKNTAVSQVDEIRMRANTVDEILTSREDALLHIAQEKEDCEKALKECEDKITQMKNSLEGYILRLENRQRKIKEHSAGYEELSARTNSKRQRLNMLLDLQRNMEGYSGAVKNVIAQSKHKTLRGIRGALAELISTDSEYAVAIETALGNALQNVVTENENDAKRAINYLKQNKLGRVTFLPISAIRTRDIDEKGIEDCVGYVDKAVNLVKCDKEYKSIISGLLGKTVVAEDMDSAVAMSKKYKASFKIVTLDGQVINTGGSMTGGSKAKNVGALSRVNEIERLEKELAASESELRQAAQENTRLTEELAKCRADVDAVNADIISAGEDRIRSQGELKLVTQQYEDAFNSVEQLKQEKNSSNERIDSLMKTAAAAQEKIDEIEKQSAELEKKLEEFNVDKDKIAQKRREINDKAGEINIAVVEAQKDISAARDNIQALTLQKLSHAKRTDDINEEIKAIEDNSEQARRDIAATLAQRDELRKKVSEAKAQIDEIVAGRQQSEKLTEDLRLKEKQTTTDREHLGGEIARLEERKLNMLKEFDDAVNKLYDEYELTRSEAEALDIELRDIQQARQELSSLRNKIKALGNVNVSAIEEYTEVKERYDFLKLQIEDVQASERELSKLIKELTNKMSARFTEQFEKINESFASTMSEFFSGGKAQLILEDPDNVLECGIDIQVQPPGKNVKNIALLSGGEKALAAVALLFAILKVTPAPFCIYDEVEAALDDVNVDRFAKYMRKMCSKIQFISITHRRGTMEEADVLYGVTMQEKGVSKLLELKLNEVAKKLGI